MDKTDGESKRQCEGHLDDIALMENLRNHILAAMTDALASAKERESVVISEQD